MKWFKKMLLLTRKPDHDFVFKSWNTYSEKKKCIWHYLEKQGYKQFHSRSFHDTIENFFYHEETDQITKVTIILKRTR